MSALPQSVDSDYDGTMRFTNEAYVRLAARALAGEEHPLVALERIYNLARMASVVWLKEQFELEAVKP